MSLQEKLTEYILACQDEETGGFSDRPGDMVSLRIQFIYGLFIFTGWSLSHTVWPGWPLTIGWRPDKTDQSSILLATVPHRKIEMCT